MAEKEHLMVKIAKRPWYEWLLWALWLGVEFFLLQNALASGQELEPRAAILFWIMFIVLLIGGGIVWFLRRAR